MTNYRSYSDAQSANLNNIRCGAPTMSRTIDSECTKTFDDQPDFGRAIGSSLYERAIVGAVL